MTATKRIPKKYKILGLTLAQQRWLWDYEQSTMLEPMMLEDLQEDPKKFDEVAKWNIQHYEDVSIDALHAISRDVPYTITAR